ncbi:MAG: lysylphosphatidylglycerol synthase domain-containing protein [Jiangellales bacterium]
MRLPRRRGRRSVTSGRGLLWRVAGTVFVLAALGFVVASLVRDADEVRAAVAELSISTLVASFAAALVGLWCTSQAWRVLLRGLGHPVPVLAGAAVFFISQLGKYVPGSVWPYVAQARLGTDLGVAPARSAQAGVTFVLLHLLTGMLVGIPRLLFGADLDARFAWALLLVPAVLVLVHPAVTAALVRLAGRVMRIDVVPAAAPWTSVAAAVGWLGATWVFYGLSLAALVAPLTPVDGATFVQLTSAYALAWSVGFVGAAVVVVAAPAGLGFREVALLTTLAGVVDTGAAALVVLLSRVVMTLGDVTMAAVTARAARSRTRS